MAKRLVAKEIWKSAYTGHNRLCAVSIKTTGPDSKKNEIIQICAFPLNNQFELSREILPFYSDILPIRSRQHVNSKYIRNDRYNELLNSNADMPQVVATLFDNWMLNKIKLDEDKKLLPVVYNWAWSRPFIKNWLGQLNFDSYFSDKYRDILSIVLFINDYNDRLNRDIPYLKTTLVTLSKTLHVEYKRHDETILQCKSISEVYNGVMRNM